MGSKCTFVLSIGIIWSSYGPEFRSGCCKWLFLFLVTNLLALISICCYGLLSDIEEISIRKLKAIILPDLTVHLLILLKIIRCLLTRLFHSQSFLCYLLSLISFSAFFLFIFSTLLQLGH